MKNEEMTELTNKIQEKLGKEGTSKIADDLARIITNNTSMNNDLSNKDSKITQLENDKELLMMSNASLLQQVAMKPDDDEKEKNKGKDPENKEINFASFFDEKGNFKK